MLHKRYLLSLLNVDHKDESLHGETIHLLHFNQTVVACSKTRNYYSPLAIKMGGGGGGGEGKYYLTVKICNGERVIVV